MGTDPFFDEKGVCPHFSLGTKKPAAAGSFAAKIEAGLCHRLDLGVQTALDAGNLVLFEDALVD